MTIGTLHTIAGMRDFERDVLADVPPAALADAARVASEERPFDLRARRPMGGRGLSSRGRRVGDTPAKGIRDATGVP
jgi:hypothetical protein